MKMCLLLLVAPAQFGPAQNAAPPPVAAPATTSATTQAAPQQSTTSPPAAPQTGTTQSAAPQTGAVPQIPVDPCIAQAEFCALVESGRLADLRWPNFSDYRKEVKDFYQAAGYSLAWITTAQNQLTPQARA